MFKKPTRYIEIIYNDDKYIGGYIMHRAKIKDGLIPMFDDEVKNLYKYLVENEGVDYLEVDDNRKVSKEFGKIKLHKNTKTNIIKRKQEVQMEDKKKKDELRKVIKENVEKISEQKKTIQEYRDQQIDIKAGTKVDNILPEPELIDPNDFKKLEFDRAEYSRLSRKLILKIN